jgi:hypothetical protein
VRRDNHRGVFQGDDLPEQGEDLPLGVAIEFARRSSARIYEERKAIAAGSIRHATEAIGGQKRLRKSCMPIP